MLEKIRKWYMVNVKRTVKYEGIGCKQCKRYEDCTLVPKDVKDSKIEMCGFGVKK